jgi:hypothetical protein
MKEILAASQAETDPMAVENVPTEQAVQDVWPGADA